MAPCYKIQIHQRVDLHQSTFNTYQESLESLLSLLLWSLYMNHTIIDNATVTTQTLKGRSKYASNQSRHIKLPTQCNISKRNLPIQSNILRSHASLLQSIMNCGTPSSSQHHHWSPSIQNQYHVSLGQYHHITSAN